MRGRGGLRGVRIRNLEITDEGVEIVTGDDELTQGAAGGAEGVKVFDPEAVFFEGAAKFGELSG